MIQCPTPPRISWNLLQSLPSMTTPNQLEFTPVAAVYDLWVLDLYNISRDAELPACGRCYVQENSNLFHTILDCPVRQVYIRQGSCWWCSHRHEGPQGYYCEWAICRRFGAGLTFNTGCRGCGSDICPRGRCLLGPFLPEILASIHGNPALLSFLGRSCGFKISLFQDTRDFYRLTVKSGCRGCGSDLCPRGWCVLGPFCQESIM